ncbi:hypothetical protein BD410DRAFT_836519 [Rickenella mellea]|uniref:Protein kinase domain-containing protein n=1 Tax=Rickenella mellea TaxID=50990 RepID=A0A4Y7QHD8_9AGAM|nr:hypothetical protein BD410DRAFT_836519 [Rickenella mellea]
MEEQRGSHKVGIDYLGRDIYMKALRRDSREISVLRHLLQPSLKSDPRNHTIPVLRIIDIWGWSIVVQPRWGTEWQKPLKGSGSVVRRVEIARDLVEGLAFMHLNGVAHGDIHPSNILCGHENARYVDPARQKDGRLHQAFIDFESAVIFPPQAVHHCVTIEDLDTKPPSTIRAPEQEEALQWDGFAADVYNLGRCFQLQLLTTELQANHELVDIFNDMTRCDASSRITAEDAFRGLDTLLKEERKLQGGI